MQLLDTCYGGHHPDPDLKFRRGVDPLFSAEAPCERQRLRVMEPGGAPSAGFLAKRLAPGLDWQAGRQRQREIESW